LEFRATKSKNADNGTARAAPIRPFHAFKSKMLPKQIKRYFNLHWRPIFEMMDACPGMLPLDDSANNLNDWFDRGLEFLKTRVAYVFQRRKANPIKWELSTWSKHVRHSSIMKYGIESVKASLPTNTTRFQQCTKYRSDETKKETCD
jgi:hypothetical protein